MIVHTRRWQVLQSLDRCITRFSKVVKNAGIEGAALPASNEWWKSQAFSTTAVVNPKTPTTSSSSVLLFISNIWPQPSASAAGVRTSFMIEHLAMKYQVHFCTGATIHEQTKEGNSAKQEMQRLQHDCGVRFHPNVPPNNSQAIQSLIMDIGVEPDLIIFDRFYNEEAYSFHFHEHCPNAVLVLDMQDLHCLRHGRQGLVKVFETRQRQKSEEATEDPFDCLSDVMNFRPSVNDPRFLRELASLHRCDLILVCSPVEYDLLIGQFQISPTKLCMASFWVEPPSTPCDNETFANTNSVAFENTRDFVFVGGFRHDPNADAVQVLQDWIWPQLRKHLPTANLFVYGAYSDKNKQHSTRFVHNPSQGFHVMGYAPSLDDIFANKRVSLAPLRFGAGIKGKIVDSWKYGVPVVTTPVGTEGMTTSGEGESLTDESTKWGNLETDWGGKSASTLDDFCRAAIVLYTSASVWDQCRISGKRLLSQLYPINQWYYVEQALHDALTNRTSRRSEDILRATIWYQALRSTEYFSKWIESSNRSRSTESAKVPKE